MLWGLHRVIMIMNANIASLMTNNLLKKLTYLNIYKKNQRGAAWQYVYL